MAKISADVVVDQLLAALAEAFDGPPEGFGYFLDRGDDAGLKNLLAKLSAAEASRKVAGSCIAAHVDHLAFALEAAMDYIQGGDSSKDWAESWSVSTVDEASWSRLRERLRQAYADLRQAIEAHALSSELAIGLAVGAPAHTAYHIGAIRQKLALIRQG
ncbi:MAG TPA: hypothetical protein VGZ22_01660 [Isosphaeraceae bacterium]|jgi:hypothetical protein|nr:hypothetical protein [Isosphaeraceae bacterium]